MGIPFYFYVITRAHPGILLSHAAQAAAQPARLFLDFNGAVYQACHKLSANGLPVNDETVIDETITYLKWLADTVRPSVELGICLDGVAPRAKMVQQRKRRFMGMFRAQLEKQAGIAASSASWDTCAISPGTAFMKKLAGALRDTVALGPAAVGGDPACRAWVSPADEPGEGEHKIFHHLATKCATGDATGAADATYIYGLDADLIMLSLVAHRPRIYLMREPTQASVKTDAKTDGPFVYVNIDALRRGILDMVRTRYNWPVSAAAMADLFCDEARQWIETYIVICFLLGNDFLPPLPALTLKEEGLEALLQAYGRICARAAGAMADTGDDAYASHAALVNTATAEVQWDVLAALIEECAADEDGRVYQACKKNVEARSHAREPEDKIEFYPSLPENRDPVARAIASLPSNAGPAAWRQTYYMGLFNTSRANVPRLLRESTQSYLLGMAWTYRYYRREAKDPAWFYPFSYAPTARDLLNVLQAERANLQKIVQIQWPARAKEVPEFVAPEVQLLAILPPSSVDLLPPRLRPFMLDDAPGCRHFFPAQFKVHTYLKHRLWECSPILPVLDVDWIETRARLSS